MSRPRPPPRAPTILFDGKSLEKWEKRGGGEADWRLLPGGVMEVNGGDILTKEKFAGTFKLHVEFRVPSMPNETGQRRGNSGVYVQGRYEVQILDSFGLPPSDRDCGAIYRFAAPLVNACKAPLVWQSYDIDFTAPVCKDGKKVEPGRITVHQNGVLIHDHVPLTTDGTLESLGGDPCTPGPVMLQGLYGPVQFRNIWLVRPEGKLGEVRELTWPGGKQSVFYATFSPDGRYLLAGGDLFSSTTAVWETAAGKLVTTIPTTAGAVFLPGNRHILGIRPGRPAGPVGPGCRQGGPSVRPAPFVQMALGVGRRHPCGQLRRGRRRSHGPLGCDHRQTHLGAQAGYKGVFFARISPDGKSDRRPSA